jgi:hypothetical protein
VGGFIKAYEYSNYALGGVPGCRTGAGPALAALQLRELAAAADGT